MPPPRCIVFVHAHPDDEALSTGGTIARYAADGARVVLITCTNGEAGEIAEVPGLGPPDELRPRLGEIRRAELEEACAHLGPIDLRLLGYHDSGMAGTPENDAPVAFINQDVEEVTSKVAAIIDETNASVVVTYNEFGAYGHPDHIRAHEAAVAAAERCGVPKLYYTAFPRSMIELARDMAGHLGIDPDEFVNEDEIARLATPDDEITTVIDCSAFVEHKFRALEAHRTQLGTTQMFLSIPQEFRPMLGTEHYVLARSAVARDGIEDDLFEGL